MSGSATNDPHWAYSTELAIASVQEGLAPRPHRDALDKEETRSLAVSVADLVKEDDNRPPRSSSPNFGAFYSSSANTELDVRRDIALLSYLLAYTKVKDRRSNSNAEGMDRKRALGALDPWTYLAHIVNTGHDKSSNSVIAVTGRIDRDAITAALVQNTVTSPKPGTPSFRIELLHPEDRKIGLLLLRKPTKCPSVEHHIRDVFTIVNYLITSSPPTSQMTPLGYESILTSLFFMFIAKRCYLKFLARIANGERMWSAHPTSLIRAWYASDNSDRNRSFVPQTLLLPATLEHALARTYKLSPARNIRPPSSGRLTYLVGPENVSKWAEMLVRCQEELEALLLSLQEEDIPDVVMDAGQESAFMLDTVFQNGLLEILLTDELVAHMQTCAESALRDARRPMLNSYVLVSNEKLPSESNRQHIIRYLKTPVIPFAAARFLVSYCRKLAPPTPRVSLNAFMVHSTSSTPPVSQEHVNTFKCQFLEHFTFPKDHRDVIDKALSSFRVRYNGTLHAEAVIMALAYAVRVHPDKGARKGADLPTYFFDVAPVFQAHLIPIGASKKCCFCCDLLASLMMDSEDGKASPRFLLQDTHSTIFPWIAPDGIPLSVSMEMRSRLLKIFYDSVTTYATSVPSLQTSPAYSISELPKPLASRRLREVMMWSKDD
ncbi:hypothetical protein EVG20_g1054 [Dentipellis fragilis]|uniref:Uncharacterized protein n=1 Tax=Dentipellis fragilis TaxID=205917 RepID=A0A4Y9ZDJ8_9AGAM|nr:hypothetical protein EVG20_g1054 [Dentipellis fragilis]